MTFFHIDAQACQLGNDVTSCSLAVVGQKQKRCVRIQQMLDEPVSDLDPTRVDKAAVELKDPSVKKYKDFRKLLENKDIDSVSVTTAGAVAALVVAGLVAGVGLAALFVAGACVVGRRRGGGSGTSASRHPGAG